MCHADVKFACYFFLLIRVCGTVINSELRISFKLFFKCFEHFIEFEYIN